LRGSESGSDDRFSVTSATANIHSTLDDISASRASRVSRLAQLYSSGRYTADGQATAKGVISGAESVKI
jgi:hypothetical protein